MSTFFDKNLTDKKYEIILIIKYAVVRISNTPKYVYHLKTIIIKTVDVDTKANAISERFSLNHADVVACLSALNSQIIFNLKADNKIDLA